MSPIPYGLSYLDLLKKLLMEKFSETLWNAVKVCLSLRKILDDNLPAFDNNKKNVEKCMKFVYRLVPRNYHYEKCAKNTIIFNPHLMNWTVPPTVKYASELKAITNVMIGYNRKLILITFAIENASTWPSIQPKLGFYFMYKINNVYVRRWNILCNAHCNA